MNDLASTNFWLAVIAMVSVVELLALVGAAWMAYRLYHRTFSVIDDIRQQEIAPLVSRATGLIEDLQDLSSRLRRVDDVVQTKVEQAGHGFQQAGRVVKDQLWPAVGLVRALRAGFNAWTDGGRTRHVRIP